MKILYITTFVLGDAGANAADIFPRLAAQSDAIEAVYVADFPKNKHHIEQRQGARYLRLDPGRTWLRHAARIARKCRDEQIDIVHVFYRQQNAVLLMLIRLWLWVLKSHTVLVMDHRSVNLARGWRGWRKRALNAAMQLCTHHLAGNPWAVETNHISVFRPKHLIDLGYDTLPDGAARAPETPIQEVMVWFIGTLKPRNRKSDFLFEVFAALGARTTPSGRAVRFHVAGPTRPDQAETLAALDNVTYHGTLPRADLYAKLRATPGLGLAYMNRAFHEYAPSLKFAEYAIMRFGILASDTVGLRTQAARMHLPAPVRFVPETATAWAEAILDAAEAYQGLDPDWQDAPRWSYARIFARQVLPLYRQVRPPCHDTQRPETATAPRIDAHSNEHSDEHIVLHKLQRRQTLDHQHVAHAERQLDPALHIGGNRGDL